MVEVSVNYVQNASGQAVLSCVACRTSVLLAADAADDDVMTAFVIAHRACANPLVRTAGNLPSTCDSCRGVHNCWTCEDENGCHPAEGLAGGGSHVGPTG